MKLRLSHVFVVLATVGIGIVATTPWSASAADPAPATATATAPATVPATRPIGVSGQGDEPAVPLVTGVHPVKLVKTDGKWQLLRDEKPYFIKGVGGDSSREQLVAAGGNTIRLWGVDPKKTPVELNEDAKLGVTVAMGYWVGHKDNGFKWDNPEAVKNQLEEFKKVVRTYKDCPAVLVWAIGNEMENSYGVPALYQAIEDMAKAAHEIDPNHPTMTVIAEVGGDKVGSVHKFCPSIDIVGINSYAGGPSVGERYLKQAGATPKPYAITEFGPPGQWEYWIRSSFGVLKEMSSNEKAKWYNDTYTKTVLGHPNECVGSFAFLWGNKVEMTATWYGMILPDGSKTPPVDTMQELWSGKKTETPCPVISKIAIAGAEVAPAESTIKANIEATDPKGGKLTYEWVLCREMSSYEVMEPGADAVPTFPDAILKNGEAEVSVKMPKTDGIYRLYAYVRNETKGASLASLPIKVTGGETAPIKAPKATLPFVILGEGKAANNYISSGWFGDTKFIAMKDATDGTRKCMAASYNVTKKEGGGFTCPDAAFDATKLKGTSGISWQHPVNDWGMQPGGYDFTGAKKLIFSARGAKGGEVVTFGAGYLTKETQPGMKYYDSARVLQAVTLTTEWKEYTIDVSGKNLSLLKSGFFWSAEAGTAPINFFVADVRFE